MHKWYPFHLKSRLNQIELAVFDIDGVMTDGTITYSEASEVVKNFNVQDGLGLKMLLQHNILVAIISGRNSPIINKRMQELGINEIHIGINDKLAVYKQLLEKYQISFDQTCYMGDDTPDYQCLKQASVAICPQNAHPIITSTCDWIIPKIGGNGAVRALCDGILAAKFGNEFHIPKIIHNK